MMKRLKIAATASAIGCMFMMASTNAKAASFAPYAHGGCANDVATDGNYLFVIGCNTFSDGDYGIYASVIAGQGPYAALPGGARFISAGGGEYGNNAAGTSLSIVNNAQTGYFFDPTKDNFYVYPEPGAVPIYRIANQYQSNNPGTGYVSTTNPNGNGPIGVSTEWALLGNVTSTGYPIAYRTNPAGGTTTTWTTVPGDAVEISVGQTNVPFVINTNGDVFEWLPSKGYFGLFAPWNHGFAYAVAVDSTPNLDSIWITNDSGQVYHYTAVPPAIGSFVQVTAPAQAGRIAAAYTSNLDEVVFIIAGSGAGNIYEYVN